MRPTDGSNNKELNFKLEEMYKRLPIKNPADDQEVKELYEKWLEGQDSDKTAAVLHTQYHAVEKMNTALNIKW